jgi:hypothetical protein
MTRVKFAVALLAVLALAGCYPPVTTHPLGSNTPTKPDAALAGVWKGVDTDGKPHYVHFLQQSDSTISAVVVESGAKAEDWFAAKLTCAKLGANRFLNGRLEWTNNKPEHDIPGTVPVIYSIDAKGALTLAMMDEDKVKDAVRAGKIKGMIEKGQFGDVTITESPAALDKLFASPAVTKLFAQPFLTLHRVD